MKKYAIVIAVAILTVISLVVEFSLYLKMREENSRLATNALTFSRYETARSKYDSTLFARCREQTVTIRELEQDRQDITTELDNIRVKLKRLQSASVVGQTHSYELKLDTVFIYDTVHDAFPMRYEDRWISALYTPPDSLHIIAYDSLIIAYTTRRKRFLFWTWNKHTGETTVKNFNPHVNISYLETINIEK